MTENSDDDVLLSYQTIAPALLQPANQKNITCTQISLKQTKQEISKVLIY